MKVQYKKVLVICQKYGLGNFIVGIIRKSKNKKLQKKYGFSKWHLTPIQFRPYALDIVKIVKKYISDGSIVPQSVIEVGCGLGDIVGGVGAEKAIGYDISEEVLCGAKVLHPKVSFRTGSFGDITVGEIGCLIMVNFIHELSPEELCENIDILLKNNSVKVFVFDLLSDINGTQYRYQHDGKRILGGYGYERLFCSEEYETIEGAKRRIELWRIQ